MKIRHILWLINAFSEFENTFSQTIKVELLYIVPILTYGTEVWTITESEKRILILRRYELNALEGWKNSEK